MIIRVTTYFVYKKRVMRILYGAKAQDHTNNLFINLNVMKLFDYTEYKTVITMYKAKYKLLPKNILKLFHSRDECCHITRQREINLNKCLFEVH